MELIYVESVDPLSDLSGGTYKGKVIKEIEKGKYLVQLENFFNFNAVIIEKENLLSRRKLRNLKKTSFYHFGEQDHPVASNFLRINKKFDIRHHAGLGSGIYGNYLKPATKKVLYKITLSNAFFLQDKEHGESLTLASLSTLKYLNDYFAENIDLQSFLKNNDPQDLVEKWNIVLARNVKKMILNSEDLKLVILKFLENYNHPLTDSYDGSFLVVQPVNVLLTSLGFDGIIATDEFNNSWDRGCVKFDFQDCLLRA